MLKNILKPPRIQWPAKFSQKHQLCQDKRLKQFYQTGLPDADTPLSQTDFVAMDFETTGLDARKNDIISIGIVPFTLQRIHLRQAQQWTLRPRHNMDEESVIIHGITHSDIIAAPDLEHILDEFLPCISGKILVVHYRHIERDFLDLALKRRIGEGIEFPVIDTLEIENQIQRRAAGGLWNRLQGKRMPSLRLAQSRERYGLPHYAPHHALTDAIATAELLQAQIAYHYSPEQTIDTLWL